MLNKHALLFNGNVKNIRVENIFKYGSVVPCMKSGQCYISQRAYVLAFICGVKMNVL